MHRVSNSLTDGVEILAEVGEKRYFAFHALHHSAQLVAALRVLHHFGIVPSANKKADSCVDGSFAISLILQQMEIATLSLSLPWRLPHR